MKTKAQEVAALEAKFVKEREAIDARFATLEAIGLDLFAGYEEPKVHSFRLYGSVGSIHFDFCNYDSLREGKDPDRALLSALLAKFLPVPLVKVKDGHTSFRPDRTLEGISERAQQYDCYGVMVQLEPPGSIQPAVTVEWYAEINENLWRFEVSTRIQNADFGDVSTRYKGRNASEDDRTIDSCTLSAKHNAQFVKWATGDFYRQTRPNKFTLFWDRDSGAALDFPAIMFANQKTQTPSE